MLGVFEGNVLRMIYVPVYERIRDELRIRYNQESVQLEAKGIEPRDLETRDWKIMIRQIFICTSRKRQLLSFIFKIHRTQVMFLETVFVLKYIGSISNHIHKTKGITLVPLKIVKCRGQL